MDTSKTLYEIFLEVTADRGAEYPCPVWGVLCKAHGFLAAIADSFPFAKVSVDEVSKAEAKQNKLPKATRWAVLKAADGGRPTIKQQKALNELESGGLATATGRTNKIPQLTTKNLFLVLPAKGEHP